MTALWLDSHLCEKVSPDQMQRFAHQVSPVNVDQTEEDFVLLRNAVKDARELYGLPREAIRPVQREVPQATTSDHDSEGESEEEYHSENDNSDDEENNPSRRTVGVQTQQLPEYASVGIQTDFGVSTMDVDDQPVVAPDTPGRSVTSHPAIVAGSVVVVP